MYFAVFWQDEVGQNSGKSVVSAGRIPKSEAQVFLLTPAAVMTKQVVLGLTVNGGGKRDVAPHASLQNRLKCRAR